MNLWYEDANGVVSAIGSCASFPSFKSGKYEDNTYHYTLCNGNNCNNVLICYTGAYYQNQAKDRINNYKASLCNYNANQVCQTTVTYNALYGYAFQGACKDQGQCQNVVLDLTGD